PTRRVHQPVLRGPGAPRPLPPGLLQTHGALDRLLCPLEPPSSQRSPTASPEI
ncbi:unnamed protein product, partial [Boreogadus saida]